MTPPNPPPRPVGGPTGRPTPAALRYADLLAEAAAQVPELMPWDLQALLQSAAPPLVLDVREPAEFALAHVAGSLLVPRGLLEAACEWDYDDTVPELVAARQRTVVVVCRSGNRSLLAALQMQRMGYQDVRSLRTGIRGWNDAEQPLLDGAEQPVSADDAEPRLAARVRPAQRAPAR
jgi:rhodanese-related sulfurtransferase